MTSWAGSVACILVSVWSVGVVKCKPQVYEHVVNVPLQVPYSPFFGVWTFPYQSFVQVPFIFAIPSYTQEEGVNLPHVSNVHNLVRQDAPSEVADKLTQNQKNFVIFGGPNPPAPQCGVSEPTLVRADEVQRNKESIKKDARFQAPEEEEATEQGTVLLTSPEFEGPDLSETAFNQYKGNTFIVSLKITYGLPTHNTEAPWQVAMFVGGKFHCGASIIGEKHILTAAHCVTAYKRRPSALKLSLGDWDLKTTTDGKNLDVEVQTVKPHASFNFFNLQNDIAVLELKDKITFNSRINAICLPPADLEAEGMPATVTGWGRNEKNLLQTRLHKLTAIVLENNICADRWSRTGAPRSLIGLGTICMDSQFGDSCKGDSGGPAVMQHPANSGIYVQAGIVSFGSGSCTDANLPGVYTRVASYRDWILEQMA